MARKPLNDELIKQFSETFTSENTFYYPEDIVYALVEKGLCTLDRVRNYMILHQYGKLLVEGELNHSEIAVELASEYDLTIRQILNITYKYRRAFHRSRNVIDDSYT